jgi:hypothetical protein
VLEASRPFDSIGDSLLSSMIGAKRAAFCTQAFLGSLPTGTGSPPKTSSGGGDSPNLRHSLEKRFCFIIEGDGGGGVNGDKGVDGDDGECVEGTLKKFWVDDVDVGDKSTVEVGEEFGKLKVMEEWYE